MNFRPMQGNCVCYDCNKSGHIAKYYKSRNVNRRGLKDKNKNVKVDEKGKAKFEEIIDQMKKTWVKKSDLEAGSGSAPYPSAGTTSSN